MDISTLAPKETTTFFLMHPVSGEELDIEITVYSSDSKVYKSTLHKLRNARNGKRVGRITSEETEQNSLEILAACTKAWKNMVVDGEEVKCTKENAKAIYKQERFTWIREQVDYGIGSRENFLG